jgi:hypothetical protein
MKRALFWTLAAVTLAIYLTMVLWSLPFISAEAGGLVPFDMRPTGYSFDEARAFLAALTEEGNAFYRDVQHTLDLFFPGLIAATLFFAIAALLPKRLGRWRYALAAPVVLTAVFDWAENSAVAGMLTAGADGITEDMVRAANGWSIAKATASTVAYTALLVLLIWKGAAWWRRRPAA